MCSPGATATTTLQEFENINHYCTQNHNKSQSVLHYESFYSLFFGLTFNFFEKYLGIIVFKN